MRLLLSVLLSTLFASLVSMRGQCIVGVATPDTPQVQGANQGAAEMYQVYEDIPSSTALLAFPKNAFVGVYMDPSFSSEQVQAIWQALLNWREKSDCTGNNSGVTFAPATTAEQLQTFPQHLLIAPGVPLPEQSWVGHFVPTEWMEGPEYMPPAAALKGMRMELNLAEIAGDLRVMTWATAHEIGHGMGLLDCWDCGLDRTVMTSGIVLSDSGLLLVAPGTCDSMAVRSYGGHPIPEFELIHSGTIHSMLAYDSFSIGHSFQVSTAGGACLGPDVALSFGSVPPGTHPSSYVQSPVYGGDGTSAYYIIPYQTPAGDYPFSILGQGGGYSKMLSLTAHVSDYKLSADATDKTVKRGDSVTFTIIEEWTNGIYMVTLLNLLGAPSGMTGLFDPANIPKVTPGTSVLTIQVSKKVPAGPYVLTVRGGGTVGWYRYLGLVVHVI